MHLQEVEGRKGFKEYTGKGVRFYIKKMEGEDSLYSVGEFRKLKSGSYILLETIVNLRSTGLDEPLIFKEGRSRSKYANVLKIYTFYGPKALNAKKSEFTDINEVKREIFRLFVNK